MNRPKHPPIRIGRRHAFDIEIIGTLTVAMFVVFMVIALFDSNSKMSQVGAISSGALATMLGAVTRFAMRERRTLKLRLIPGGLRVTEFHRTTNWHAPRIQNPKQPKDGRNNVKLNASDDPRQVLELHLWEFDLRDRIAIIEHISQFLTPEQQAAHGKDWVRWHARLLAPRKPMKWARPMLLFHLVCFGGLGLIASFYGLMHFLMPLDFGPMMPHLARTLVMGFSMLMLVFDAMFFFLWLDVRRSQKEHHDLIQSIGRGAC